MEELKLIQGSAYSFVLLLSLDVIRFSWRILKYYKLEIYFVE